MTNFRNYSPLGFLNKKRQHKLKDQETLANEATIAEHIPYRYHVTESVVKTDNKEFIISFELKGKSAETLDAEDVFIWKESLNNHIRSILSTQGDLSFWTYVIREKIELSLNNNFSNQFCQELNESYLKKFSSGQHFVNRLFLSIVLKQQGEESETLQILQDITAQLQSSLNTYSIETLSIYKKGDILFSRALEFYSYLINKEWIQIPILNTPANTYMSVNRLFCGNEQIEVLTRGKKSIASILDIKEYNEFTHPEQFNDFLSMPFEMTICQSFCGVPKLKSKELLSLQQKHLVSSNDGSMSQTEQLDEAIDDLESGRIVFGEHHCNIIIWSDNPYDLEKNMSKGRELLSDMGMIPKIVSPRPEIAFFACLHQPSYRLRPSLVSSKNFACFANFHNHFLGKKDKNPWGKAVTIFETSHLTPAYFNFHEELAGNQEGDKALGNTVIIGQSGSGKTVLANMLLSNLNKFDVTAVFFDKDKGAKISLLAMGGKYFDLKLGERTHWNPFQLDNTPENLIFLNGLVKSMLCYESRSLSIKQITELEFAIKTLMSIDEKQYRNLKNLAQALPHNTPEDTGYRLKEWLDEGQYAWLFDNETDTLDMANTAITGFDCTEFLEYPTIRTPLMMYLLYRMEQCIDGRRFVFFMDEFWKLLEDEVFTDFAKDKLKTIRKQNGLGVFMTQEPADALNSTIGKTIVQQTATQILLPNPKADEEDYTKGLKLTQTEFANLKSFDVGSRQFLIKKSNSSVVAKLNLKGFKELQVLSGNTQNTILIEKLIEKNYSINKWLNALYEAGA